MKYKATNETQIYNSSDFIKWEKKFEIGIPVIDEQHKKLVEICNNLYLELMKNKQSGILEINSPIKKALSDTVEYVKVHFSTEEKLMQAVNYTDFAAHKKKHELFIKKIIDTSSSLSTESFSHSFQFVRFMYEWILEHVAHEDRLYVAAVRNAKK